MISKLFASVLCIALSPLLVAQQAASINIPKDTKIELVSLERVSSKAAFQATVRSPSPKHRRKSV